MNLSEPELKALISAAQAYAVRTHCRKVAKAAKTAKEAAEKEWLHFSRFEDCGSSYDAWFEQAKGVFDNAVSDEIASEKAFKKAKLSAIEAYPGLQGLIEQFIFPDPGKVDQKKPDET